MADEKPMGSILDSLGVTCALTDTQTIVEAVVIAKVVDFDQGEVSCVLSSSRGLDWIARRGLMAAARDIMSGGCERVDDD